MCRRATDLVSAGVGDRGVVFLRNITRTYHRRRDGGHVNGKRLTSVEAYAKTSRSL